MGIDFVVWDIGDVYAMARSVRDFLVSCFSAMLPVFFLLLLVSSIAVVLHWLFGRNGIF